MEKNTVINDIYRLDIFYNPAPKLRLLKILIHTLSLST